MLSLFSLAKIKTDEYKNYIQSMDIKRPLVKDANMLSMNSGIQSSNKRYKTMLNNDFLTSEDNQEQHLPGDMTNNFINQIDNIGKLIDN